MRVITNKNTINIDFDSPSGESNGYLVIDDKKHPWFGKEFDEIDIEVHGGLTYSGEVTEYSISRYEELTDEDLGAWMIGFDTCHDYPAEICDDVYFIWNDDAVRIHAENYMLKPAKAMAGDVEAQYELGLLYEQGRGVIQDDEAAVKWFTKAADQGHAGAKRELEVIKQQEVVK